ncbi:hypothetical protein [uncultured Williamsia sp.]|uniref:hypothetical protein n=1 Tax=uncultured Williamsia sp. TaxID=259311 RepID=UPI002631B457|nr:hypothetical protein [uncultured Williamsia sp.]
MAEANFTDDPWHNLDEYIKWHDRLRDVSDAERELVRFIEELHRFAVVSPSIGIGVALENVRRKLSDERPRSS